METPFQRPQFSRRQFLSALAVALASGCTSRAGGTRPARILLCSSWQTVNIGDIAHTPGFLNLMETHLPEVETTLWPGGIGDGVRETLLERFPGLKIAETEEELTEAFEECDFLVHGSGATLVAPAKIKRWVEATGKSFGIYGITFDDHQSWKLEPDSPEEIQQKLEWLNRAEFVFFRDTASLEYARSLGCKAGTLDFAPDAAFACDLSDDSPAEAYLAANGLQPGKFLCCIPRLRFSPYWRMKEGRERDEHKHRFNERMKEQDNAPLREAVKRVVEETDLKVLLCPEDTSQMRVNKELIYDHLSEQQRRRVVWKEDFWLTGEALSTYRRSAGLFGNEMHSPIMCIGNGIPAIVCRWEGQTTKGLVWKDIGLEDWLFNFDLAEDRARMPEAVVRLALDPEDAFQKAAMAREVVEARQQATMAHLGEQLE